MLERGYFLNISFTYFCDHVIYGKINLNYLYNNQNSMMLFFDMFFYTTCVQVIHKSTIKNVWIEIKYY